MASIWRRKKSRRIKNGVVTKATVIDYSMNLDNSYKELYEYEVGKFLVRAYSKNSSTNIGKIKGKKSYVVYDKKYPEKVQGLFDLASMSILFFDTNTGWSRINYYGNFFMELHIRITKETDIL